MTKVLQNSIYLVLMILLVSQDQSAFGQDHIKISGLAYLDYDYVFASPDADAEGENRFRYRRLYLTTDYKISDRFSGRARLETKGSSTTPFVKDLYLKWAGVFGDGHDMTMGVTSPPVYTVSEKFWDYRSLQKMIMDREGISSSRDFGIRANGSFSTSLKYGAMIANDNGVVDDNNAQKRVYGQLEWYPNDAASFTIESDYAASESGGTTNISAFGGFDAGPWRLGVEGFFNQTNFDEVNKTLDRWGLTVMAIARVNPKWEVVGRFDRFSIDLGGEDVGENFLLLAFVYEPEEDIRFMPNVLLTKVSEHDDAEIIGRMTLELNF